MARFERYAHGQFSWVDLMTPDVAAAASFYRGLFGWQAESTRDDHGGAYTLFRLDQGAGRAGSRRLSRLVTKAGPAIPPEFVLPRLMTVTGLLFHGIADWSRVFEERSGKIEERDWSAMTSL